MPQAQLLRLGFACSLIQKTSPNLAVLSVACRMLGTSYGIAWRSESSSGIQTLVRFWNAACRDAGRHLFRCHCEFKPAPGSQHAHRTHANSTLLLKGSVEPNNSTVNDMTCQPVERIIREKPCRCLPKHPRPLSAFWTARPSSESSEDSSFELELEL